MEDLTEKTEALQIDEDDAFVKGLLAANAATEAEAGNEETEGAVSDVMEDLGKSSVGPSTSRKRSKAEIMAMLNEFEEEEQLETARSRATRPAVRTLNGSSKAKGVIIQQPAKTAFGPERPPNLAREVRDAAGAVKSRGPNRPAANVQPKPPQQSSIQSPPALTSALKKSKSNTAESSRSASVKSATKETRFADGVKPESSTKAPYQYIMSDAVVEKEPEDDDMMDMLDRPSSERFKQHPGGQASYNLEQHQMALEADESMSHSLSAYDLDQEPVSEVESGSDELDFDELQMQREIALAYAQQRGYMKSGGASGFSAQTFPLTASMAEAGTTIPGKDGVSMVVPSLMPGVRQGRLIDDQLETHSDSDEGEGEGETRRIIDAIRHGQDWHLVSQEDLEPGAALPQVKSQDQKIQQEPKKSRFKQQRQAAS